ncbi:hypothetical protein EMIT07CA2_10221 [Brevibacillus sp. IT-7CA2]
MAECVCGKLGFVTGVCVIRITSDVYAHISKKIELDNMDKFESYMESVYSEKIADKSWAKMLIP